MDIEKVDDNLMVAHFKFPNVLSNVFDAALLTLFYFDLLPTMHTGRNPGGGIRVFFQKNLGNGLIKKNIGHLCVVLHFY